MFFNGRLALTQRYISNKVKVFFFLADAKLGEWKLRLLFPTEIEFAEVLSKTS